MSIARATVVLIHAWVAVAAAEERATPAPGVTVAAGAEYAGSGFRSFWLGEGYRELWATPVAVPVLDLGAFAGGLSPVRRVGRLQTPGLALDGGDGRLYTFRSLRKEPERVLPVEWASSRGASVVSGPEGSAVSAPAVCGSLVARPGRGSSG